MSGFTSALRTVPTFSSHEALILFQFLRARVNQLPFSDHAAFLVHARRGQRAVLHRVQHAEQRWRSPKTIWEVRTVLPASPAFRTKSERLISNDPHSHTSLQAQAARNLSLAGALHSQPETLQAALRWDCKS